jgi:hypothetical protein
MNEAQVDAVLARDLAEVRALEPGYEVSAGAERFMASIAVVGVVSAGASFGAAATAEGATVATPLWGSTVLAKLLGVATLTGIALAASPSPTTSPTTSPPALAMSSAAPALQMSTAAARDVAVAVPAEVAVLAQTADSTPTMPVAISAKAAAGIPPPPSFGPKLGATSADQKGTRRRGAAFAEDVHELSETRDLLAHDPLAALARAEHAGETAFREETDAVAIRALVRLGRREQAAAQAKRFLGLYPNSPFAPTARALLEAQ